MTLSQVICQTTSFGILITLEGMLQGHFTSPLIQKYNLDRFISLIQGLGDKERNHHLKQVNRQKHAIGQAHRYGIGRKLVGHYRIGGVSFPKFETRELAAEDIQRFINGGALDI